jgi:cbb3-type cytochrome oxidase cytochrome c subunit
MKLNRLVIGLATCFALPWVVLILGPYKSTSHFALVPYNEDNGDEMKGFFPPALTSNQKIGRDLYFSQGCIQCHTQVIRPQIAGDGDEFKVNWGETQNTGSPKPVRVRNTVAEDYLGEEYAPIGQRRVGPDLANAAYRFKSRQEVLEHLFHPQAQIKDSNCPPQRQLFTVKAIGGAPSQLALKSTPDMKLTRDQEVVPINDALALADYVLAMKKNYPLPISMAGKLTSTDAAKAATPAAK